MGSALDMRVLGVKEVLAQLKGVKDSVRKKVTRKALYAGAVVIRDEARRLAPVRSGALKSAIVARTDRDPENPGEYAGYVTIAKKPMVSVGGKIMSAKAAFTTKAGTKNAGKKYTKINPRRYAHLVEYGTQPHAIGKGSELSTKAAKRGKVKQAGGVHPGARAKPFLRPALESKRGEAMEAIKTIMVREVVGEAVKRGLKKS